MIPEIRGQEGRALPLADPNQTQLSLHQVQVLSFYHITQQSYHLTFLTLGVESPNSALNALGGTANVPSGSADRFNSSNPSRTVTGSSTGTPSPGAQTFDPTSTASDNTFPGPASGASKGPPLAGILVGVFVGLLLVLAIIAGVILVRRRRRRAERNGEQLISEEDDRASEPRPYMLPAPPSPCTFQFIWFSKSILLILNQ